MRLFRSRYQPEQLLNINFRGGFALPDLDLETGSTDSNSMISQNGKNKQINKTSARFPIFLYLKNYKVDLKA